MKYTVKLTHGTNAPVYIAVDAPSELEAQVDALKQLLFKLEFVDLEVIECLVRDYRYMISEGC